MPELKANTKHPQYTLNRWAWRLVRDAVEGEGSIKRADTTYLPMPAGMENMPPAPQINASSALGIETDHFVQNDPSYHPNPAYMAYKKRGHFPDITAGTVRGLMGLAVRGEPTIELPARMQYLLEGATKDGLSLEQVYDRLLANSISQGRYSLVADVDEETNEIRIALYDAKSFINWKKSKRGLRLTVFEGSAEEEDIFSHTSDRIFKVSELALDPEDLSQTTLIYTMKIFDEDNNLIGGTIPSWMGKTLDFIPAVIIGSTRLSSDVDIIPMYGIANTAVQMYQKSADLSMAEFMSCNPMLTMTGVDADDSPKVVGSTVMLTIENPDAKVFYPATDTSALTHVMAHIDKLMHEAVSYGSNLLGRDTSSAESTETVKSRQFQNGANLLSLVDVASEGMEKILKMIGTWMQLSDTDMEVISFKGNKEFSNSILTAQEQTVLVQHWMSGGMSTESYLWNLQRSGLIKGSVEEEQEFLASQMPLPTSGTVPVPDGEDAA